MSKRRVGATTVKTCRFFGGPHDGLTVEVWGTGRNVIVRDHANLVHEYLDVTVEGVSPVFNVRPVTDIHFRRPYTELVYSGWLTQEEFDHAVQLAGKA